MNEPTGLILAIETSHSPGSVAVSAAQGDAPLAVETFSAGLVHGRELFPRLEALLSNAGTSPRELALVAVSAGPGSYTGIRIGVSAAKALAWALSIPVLGLSTLEIIARNVTEETELAVVLDARRGACAYARFQRTGSRWVRRTPDAVTTPARFLEDVPPETLLVGEGAHTLEALAGRPTAPAELSTPLAAKALELARERWLRIQEGEAPPPSFTDPHRLVPSYLRPSEAEEKRARAERDDA